MRRFTFLPTELIYIFFFIWIYAFWNWSFGYKALTSIILLTVFYALRRSSIPYRDTLKNNGEIFLSPVHGIVQSIRRDTSVWDDVPITHEVRISKPAGQYMHVQVARYAGSSSLTKVHSKVDTIRAVYRVQATFRGARQRHQLSGRFGRNGRQRRGMFAGNHHQVPARVRESVQDDIVAETAVDHKVLTIL